MARTKVSDADLRAYLEAGHTQAEAARLLVATGAWARGPNPLGAGLVIDWLPVQAILRPSYPPRGKNVRFFPPLNVL
jgi:hypothetical protein